MLMLLLIGLVALGLEALGVGLYLWWAKPPLRREDTPLGEEPE